CSASMCPRKCRSRMRTTARDLEKPPAQNKSLFPKARPASKRQMIIAGIVGTVLVLFPVPQMLAEAGIVRLPLRQLYDQSFLNSAADAGAFVLLALGLNIVVGYAGLL